MNSISFDDAIKLAMSRVAEMDAGELREVIAKSSSGEISLALMEASAHLADCPFCNDLFVNEWDAFAREYLYATVAILSAANDERFALAA